MRLSGEQLVLDTNVFVHLIRAQVAGQLIEKEYAVGTRRPRAVVPIVVKAEIKSLALQLGWGATKQTALDALLTALPTADISPDPVVASYATLDHASRQLGRKMGKNDLWIAALTHVLDGTLLTTDQDFDHLHPKIIKVEYIDPEKLKQGTI